MLYPSLRWFIFLTHSNTCRLTHKRTSTHRGMDIHTNLNMLNMNNQILHPLLPPAFMNSLFICSHLPNTGFVCDSVDRNDSMMCSCFYQKVVFYLPGKHDKRSGLNLMNWKDAAYISGRIRNLCSGGELEHDSSSDLFTNTNNKGNESTLNGLKWNHKRSLGWQSKVNSVVLEV